MRFLWDNSIFKELKITSTRPSPKLKLLSHLTRLIEIALQPISRRAVQGYVTGSMTVEAALVLPLFLFFFINLGSAFEMIRLHGNLQLALWNTGNQMCVYGYMLRNFDPETFEKEESNEVLDQLATMALTYTYVKNEVIDYAGESYLRESPLVGGDRGLQFWESEINEDTIISDDILDLVLTYRVEPPLEIPFSKGFRMSNRYYGRMWTGYNLDTKEDIVYVAENASVYHDSLDCTHLRLSVKQVSLSEAKRRRNTEGKRYERCVKCWGKHSAAFVVYITNEGDCYHKERDCPGLKRTIYSMTRKEAKQKYRSCSRCGS